MLRSLFLLFALSSALGAQAPSTAWELSGNVGVALRAERGHTIGGARFGVALGKPLGGSARRIEIGLGYAQITAHDGPTGDGANIKENSFELSGLAEWPLFSVGGARVAGAIGPVAALSMGCTAGGSGAGDYAGYGEAACTNGFAKKGNVRFGGTGRLTLEFRGDRASLIVGGLGSAGTIAAGSTVAYGALVGFRAALR